MRCWNIDALESEVEGIKAISSFVNQLCKEFGSTMLRTDLWLHWEHHRSAEPVGRIPIQFRASECLFDTFFNQIDGYRAAFRRSARVGSFVNAKIIEGAAEILTTRLPAIVSLPVVASDMSCTQEMRIDRLCISRSLDPCLSKIWACTRLIAGVGRCEPLPLGISGEKINVGQDQPWEALLRNSQDCILEIKGAFVGKHGLFQTKDPERRARELHLKGQA